VEEVLPALQRAQASQGNEVVASVEVVERKSLPGRLVQFYHEVQDEMRKVTWPVRAQLKDTTIKILIFVLFIGAVIGLIDLVLQLILVQGIPSLFSGR
jgi:preprotein translocase subunit SecE